MIDWPYMYIVKGLEPPMGKMKEIFHLQLVYEYYSSESGAKTR